MTFNSKEIGKVFLKSFIASFKWTFWKFFLSSISTLGFTFFFGKTIFKLSVVDSLILGGELVLGLFTIRFLAILVKESIKYVHEVYLNSNYGEAIILLNECFASMHNYRKTPGHDDMEFVKSMFLLCNNLQEIFNKIAKNECSVSIKVPVADDSVKPQTLVMNLVRDKLHSSRDTNTYNQTQHTLLGNTAFTTCLNRVSSNSEVKYYKNNNVNDGENYENTSKLCNENGILPYNSELVFPIIPIIKVDNTCLGFICVDSIKPNAFKSKYEVAILEGVADGIYDLISARNHFKLKDYGQEHQN